MVVHAYYTSMGEAGMRRVQVRDQPGMHSKTLSPKRKKRRSGGGGDMPGL